MTFKDFISPNRLKVISTIVLGASLILLYLFYASLILIRAGIISLLVIFLIVSVPIYLCESVLGLVLKNKIIIIIINVLIVFIILGFLSYNMITLCGLINLPNSPINMASYPFYCRLLS